MGAASLLRSRRACAGERVKVDVRLIVVSGSRDLGDRFVLVTPASVEPGYKLPLVVLLHGRGEANSLRDGAFAWVERYGLVTAYERLLRPPVQRTSRAPYFTDAHLATVNASLARQPFRGLAVVCPYTPNAARASSPSRALDAYGRWLVDVVLPKAQAEVPALDAAAISIDGCSMGGYVGLEVFLRHPSVFRAWGGVQMAIGEHRVEGYADRIAQTIATVGARPLHLETSEADPFRGASVALGRALTRRSVPHELVVLPGPHDQPWLREVGTLEMLLWHERQRSR